MLYNNQLANKYLLLNWSLGKCICKDWVTVTDEDPQARVVTPNSDLSMWEVIKMGNTRTRNMSPDT